MECMFLEFCWYYMLSLEILKYKAEQTFLKKHSPLTIPYHLVPTLHLPHSKNLLLLSFYSKKKNSKMHVLPKITHLDSVNSSIDRDQRISYGVYDNLNFTRYPTCVHNYSLKKENFPFLAS